MGNYVCEQSDLESALVLLEDRIKQSKLSKEVEKKDISDIHMRMLLLKMNPSIKIIRWKDQIIVKNHLWIQCKIFQELISLVPTRITQYDDLMIKLDHFIGALSAIESKNIKPQEEKNLIAAKEVLHKLSKCIDLDVKFIKLNLKKNGTFELLLENPDDVITGNLYIDLKSPLIGIIEILRIKLINYNENMNIQSFLESLKLYMLSPNMKNSFK